MKSTPQAARGCESVEERSLEREAGFFNKKSLRVLKALLLAIASA